MRARALTTTTRTRTRVPHVGKDVESEDFYINAAADLNLTYGFRITLMWKTGVVIAKRLVRQQTRARAATTTTAPSR